VTSSWLDQLSRPCVGAHVACEIVERGSAVRRFNCFCFLSWDRVDIGLRNVFV